MRVRLRHIEDASSAIEPSNIGRAFPDIVALHTVDPATNAMTRMIEFGPFPCDTGLIGLAYGDGDVGVLNE